MGKYFGYIEGYYGKLLSWDQRFQVLGAAAQERLNTYLYAPKEDPYHRTRWREPYPRDWLLRFGNLSENGSRNGVTVIPALAPGLSYDYTSGRDYELLLDKFCRFADCGAGSLALLMDDIPDDLPATAAGRYSSLGEAHARLLSRLCGDLHARGHTHPLWFCPTIYADTLAHGPATESSYLQDLSHNCPVDRIILLWTGPDIVSEELTSTNTREISSMFGNRIVIWDNYYANDYCPGKLFVGPLRGRSAPVFEQISGLMLNPTGMPNTDMFLLSLLAGLAAGHEPDRTWDECIRRHEIPEEFTRVGKFLSSPFREPCPSDLEPTNIEQYRSALTHLIWHWKGPLHLEWYPFLYGLQNDLSLVSDAPEVCSAWLRKKYPPLIARRLDTP